MMRDIILTLAVVLSLTAIAACEDDELGIGVGGNTGLSGIDTGSFDKPGPAYYSAIMDSALSRGIGDVEPFTPMDRTDSFSPADENAYSWLDLGKVRGTHQIEWRWHSPDGRLYFTDSSWVDGNGDDRKTAYSSIGIRGSKAASMHGSWRVNVYQDGREMVNQRFTVAPDYSSFEGAPDGYQEFSSYYGDCAARPPGTYCLVFSDYYTYLAHDSVTDGVWAQAGYWNGRTIEVIYGVNADYYHILYTPLLKIVPKAAYGSDLASNSQPDQSASMASAPASGYASSPDVGADGSCDCKDMGMQMSRDGSGSWKGGASMTGSSDDGTGCSDRSSGKDSCDGQFGHSKSPACHKCSDKFDDA